MAEVAWEAADPGIDILVQEISLVLVDVSPVDATPHEAIFMRVEWLEIVLAAFAIDQGSHQCVGFFTFSLCLSPVQVKWVLAVPIVGMSSEVPIPSKDRETPVLSSHHSSTGACPCGL